MRFIANRSSGKQGHDIASALAALRAEVTLVTGPDSNSYPDGERTLHVETAQEMLAAVEAHLPADVAVFCAAVADWRVDSQGGQKIKKGAGGPPALALVENPDILATIAPRTSGRPGLVVGFAAETENVVAHARDKLARKGCDWIVANDVSAASGVMGGDRNTVHLVTRTPVGADVESWPTMGKADVAQALAERIAEKLPADRWV